MATILFKNGDQNDNVLALQKYVNANGAKPQLSEDGKFGPISAGATGVLLSNTTGLPIDSSLLTVTSPVIPPVQPPTNGSSTLNGIDIYQDQVNSWAQIFKAGFVYAWIKSSDGGTTRTQYAAYAGPAKAVGLKVGAYHFYQPNVSVQTQINVLVGQLQAAGWKAGVDLPPVLDFETFSSSDPTATDYANANAFLTGLQAIIKCKVIIYASDSVIVNAPSWIDSSVVWDARYGATPKYPNWTFFQNSGNGAVPGLNNGTASSDTDIFRGNYAALEAFIAGSVIA